MGVYHKIQNFKINIIESSEPHNLVFIKYLL